ncbi:MAG: hypothetical protein ACFFCO_11420 [Promethearchaeota archaeon]
MGTCPFCGGSTARAAVITRCTNCGAHDYGNCDHCGATVFSRGGAYKCSGCGRTEKPRYGSR